MKEQPRQIPSRTIRNQRLLYFYQASPPLPLGEGRVRADSPKAASDLLPQGQCEGQKIMNIFDLVVEYEELRTQYLEAANNLDKVTRFWNTFNPDPIGLLNNRQFLHLRDRLFELLRVCKGIDAAAFSKIHKGHPYYFIGITSYLLDDFQTAIYFLMQQLQKTLMLALI